MKQCRSCDELKPIEDFYPHVGSKDGHLNQCKTCVSLHMASYRQANLEKVRAQNRVCCQKFRDKQKEQDQCHNSSD